MTTPILCQPVNRNFEGLDLSIQKNSLKKYSIWKGECPICMGGFFRKIDTDSSEPIKIQPEIVSCTNPDHPHWFHKDCAIIWAKEHSRHTRNTEDTRPDCIMNCWPRQYKIETGKIADLPNLPVPLIVQNAGIIRDVGENPYLTQIKTATYSALCGAISSSALRLLMSGSATSNHLLLGAFLGAVSPLSDMGGMFFTGWPLEFIIRPFVPEQIFQLLILGSSVVTVGTSVTLEYGLLSKVCGFDISPLGTLGLHYLTGIGVIMGGGRTAMIKAQSLGFITAIGILGMLMGPPR